MEIYFMKACVQKSVSVTLWSWLGGTAAVAAGSNPFAMPEGTSPAMDATFYYVLCTMSLVAAAFGNFLIVSYLFTSDH